MDEKKKAEEALRNVHQRLAAAMGEIQGVNKDGKSQMGYGYVSHDAVTRVTRVALLNHGVICYPLGLKRSQDGNRTEISLTLRFVNIDRPEDFIEGPGIALSYAVKMGLLKGLMLETGEDVEKSNADHEPESSSPTATEKPRTPQGTAKAPAAAFDPFKFDQCETGITHYVQALVIYHLNRKGAAITQLEYGRYVTAATKIESGEQLTVQKRDNNDKKLPAAQATRIKSLTRFPTWANFAAKRLESALGEKEIEWVREGHTTPMPPDWSGEKRASKEGEPDEFGDIPLDPAEPKEPEDKVAAALPEGWPGLSTGINGSTLNWDDTAQQHPEILHKIVAEAMAEHGDPSKDPTKLQLWGVAQIRAYTALNTLVEPKF